MKLHSIALCLSILATNAAFAQDTTSGGPGNHGVPDANCRIKLELSSQDRNEFGQSQGDKKISSSDIEKIHEIISAKGYSIDDSSSKVISLKAYLKVDMEATGGVRTIDGNGNFTGGYMGGNLVPYTYGDLVITQNSEVVVSRYFKKSAKSLSSTKKLNGFILVDLAGKIPACSVDAVALSKTPQSAINESDREFRKDSPATRSISSQPKGSAGKGL